MPFIPEDILEEIKSKSDIYDVISSYVPLKKAGNRFKALCPFHTEKTPSFIVSPDSQTFHCFGCGKGGNVFTFVMAKEGVDFVGAAHILASRAGVFIPETKGQSNAKNEEEKTQKDRYYTIHNVMSSWYVSNLRRPEGAKGLAYLTGRNIPDDIIGKFQIGFAPDSWDAGLKYAASKGFSEIEMIDCGLALKNETSGRVYDRFRNRVVFSIWNEQGNVVAFSARAIEQTDQGGKYINSPETPIFKKSKILYALYHAKTGIREKGFAILCEGQIDAISFFRAGYNNAVAPQGTAFTEEQAMILRRHTDCVYVCFDGDTAGQNAILKAIDLLLPLEFSVKIIMLSEGQDPDDIYTGKGAAALEEHINKATDFFDYLLSSFSKNCDLKSPFEKDKIVRQMLDKIGRIKSEVVKASYISMLSSKLFIPEQSVFSEFKRTTSKIPSRNTPSVQQRPQTFLSSDITTTLSAEELLLYLCLAEGNVGRYLDSQLPNELISTTATGKALNTAISMTINGEWEFIKDKLMMMLNDIQDPALSKILTMEPVNPEKFNIDKAAAECVNHIREKQLREKIARMMSLLKENKLTDDEKRTLFELQKQQRRKS